MDLGLFLHSSLPVLETALMAGCGVLLAKQVSDLPLVLPATAKVILLFVTARVIPVSDLKEELRLTPEGSCRPYPLPERPYICLSAQIRKNTSVIHFS